MRIIRSLLVLPRLFFSAPFVLHPFLFGVYFICEGFPSIASHVTVLELFVPTGILLFFILILNLTVLLFVKDKIKSGLLSTVFVAAVLFYTDFFAFMDEKFPELGNTKYVISFTIVFVILCLWLILRTKRKLFYFNSFLNVLTACYVVYGVVLLFMGIKHGAVEKSAQITFQDEGGCQGAVLGRVSDLPDIYYIILDAYTSPASLKKYFNYDDSGFVDALGKRGFYVAEESRSLSPDTLSSMASTLNMSRSDKLLNESEEAIVDTINHNLVAKCLQAKSYQVVNLSLFDIIEVPRFYQMFFIGEKTHRNFYGLFIRMAFFNVKARLSINKVFRVNWDIIAHLKELPGLRVQKPRFIYAHVMLPHVPYCFNRSGNVIPWRKRKAEANTEAYVDQLVFTNTLILDVVDTILARSVKPPIIIIQGDHGFRRLETPGAEEEELTMLNAYHFPGGGEKALYQSISPFNSFRVLFNYYFGAHYELLKDN